MAPPCFTNKPQTSSHSMTRSCGIWYLIIPPGSKALPLGKSNCAFSDTPGREDLCSRHAGIHPDRASRSTKGPSDAKPYGLSAIIQSLLPGSTTHHWKALCTHSLLQCPSPEASGGHSALAGLGRLRHRLGAGLFSPVSPGRCSPCLPGFQTQSFCPHIKLVPSIIHFSF